MPLLNLGRRRAQNAGNAGEVGKLDYRIGNANIGQGVWLTGAEVPIPVEVLESPDFPLSALYSNTLTNTVVQVQDETPVFVNFIEASNISAADAFIQMFNSASTAAVTLGTTAPTYSFFVPKGDATNRGAMDKLFTVSLGFPKGLCIAATTSSTGSGQPGTALYVNIGGR